MPFRPGTRAWSGADDRHHSCDGYRKQCQTPKLFKRELVINWFGAQTRGDVVEALALETERERVT